MFCVKKMRKKYIASSLFVCLILFIGSASADRLEDQKYKSPDGRFIAYVIRLPKAPYGSGESKIIIKTKEGKILCSKDYGSEDGEHGFGVVCAAWTPDSAFFVYSMSNSGGHQPWHFPIDFISTRDFKIRSLDDFVGPIMNPDFQLQSPDIIRAAKQRDILEESPFEIRLSELLTKNK